MVAWHQDIDKNEFDNEDSREARHEETSPGPGPNPFWERLPGAEEGGGG